MMAESTEIPYHEMTHASDWYILCPLSEMVNGLAARGIELRSLKENIDTSTPTGKLMFHMMAALAEFERDIIQERTLAGLEAARARGRKGGRPKAISTIRPGQLERARALYVAKENTVAEIMQLTGFKNRSTFYPLPRLKAPGLEVVTRYRLVSNSIY